MRRKDREITDWNKIKGIIEACHCCRLGFQDDGKVYIVPLSFGFLEKEGKILFYFHSASKGRKIDLIRKNGYAAFELDTNYKLNEGPEACDYSARFQSVIGDGTVALVEDPMERREGLRAIMRQNTGKGDWEFSDGMFQSVCVFKLEVEALACKEHQ